MVPDHCTECNVRGSRPPPDRVGGNSANSMACWATVRTRSNLHLFCFGGTETLVKLLVWREPPSRDTGP